MWLMQLIDDGLIVYGVGQLEQSASGLMHWQFYVVTKPNPKNKNGFSLTWMKENVHKSAHWEKRMGTHEQARDYCRKDETRSAGPYEFGKWSEHANKVAAGKKGGAVHKGKLDDIKQAIDNGAEDGELYEMNFGLMLRNKKGFDAYRLTKTDKFRNHQTKGVWFWGPANTGKSTRALEWALRIEAEPYYLDLSGDKPWFDGMKIGCKVVVVEDFRGNAPISFMLKMLDHTPLQVQTKGSMMPFTAQWVIFTSNSHPKDVYGQQDANKIPADVLDAWCSRFKGSRGTIKHMTTVHPAALAEERDLVDIMFDEIEAHVPELDENNIIDLTAEEEPLTPSDTLEDDQPDVPEGGHDTYGEDVEDDDADDWNYDGRFGTEEEAIEAAEAAAAEDLEEIALRDGRLPQSRLKRTLSFHKETPVQGQFKKLGSKPSQSYLKLHNVRDEDDDDDDK